MGTCSRTIVGYPSGDACKVELIKDAAAFAKANGGSLAIGIAKDDEHLTRAVNMKDTENLVNGKWNE